MGLKSISKVSPKISHSPNIAHFMDYITPKTSLCIFSLVK